MDNWEFLEHKAIFITIHLVSCSGNIDSTLLKVPSQKLLRPNPTVGFGRIQSDLVGFSRFRSNLVGLGRIRSDTVGFGQIWSDLVGFGWIWSDLVGFGRIWSDFDFW